MDLKATPNYIFLMYQGEPLPGDYYGVIYKGSIYPILIGGILIIGAIWYIVARSMRSRK